MKTPVLALYTTLALLVAAAVDPVRVPVRVPVPVPVLVVLGLEVVARA